MAGHRRVLLALTLTATLLSGSAVVATPTFAARAATAEEALAAAVLDLHDLGYNLSGTAGSTAAGGSGTLTASGSVDPTSTAATLQLKGTESGSPIDINFTQIGRKFWAKLDVGTFQSQLGAPADRWLLFDKTKLTNPRSTPFNTSGSTDALDLGGLLNSISNVQYASPSDPTHITGIVDLTAATGVTAPDPADLHNAGVDAKKTPFTATLDGQGRLTDLTIDADSFDGDLTNDFMFSDFGSPDPVTTPPASSVIPAPASAYAFFN